MLTTVFPDIQPDGSRYSWFLRSFDERNDAADGSDEVFVPHPLKKIILAGTWSVLSTSELQQLHAHYDANSASIFTFFDFWFLTWPGLSAGTGNGVATVFTLPAKETSSLVVYVDDVITAVTPSPGTGANGEDEIIFAVAPANGLAITADCIGRRRFSLRYNPAEYKPRNMEADLFEVDLAFSGWLT